MKQRGARPSYLTTHSLLACASWALLAWHAPAAAQSAGTSPRPVLGAQVVGIAPTWQELDATQQRLLEPLAGEWNSLESTSRARWLELVSRHHSMPSEEQQRLEERIATWARLSPAERQQVRLSFQQARQLRPQDREAKWEAYQALTPERREELAGKAAQKRQPSAAAGKSAAPSAPVISASPRLPQVTPTPGISLLQVRPGATTVLITQHRLLSNPPARISIQRHFYDGHRLDPITLLPRAARDEGKS